MENSNERELELLTVRKLLSSENGRNFAWQCLQQTNVYGIVFDKDPIQHAYNAGAREVGLWLEREMKEAAPEEYLKMIGEHIND